LAFLLGDLIKGCLVIEMHGVPPSRPWGCVQASYQQLTRLAVHILHYV